MPVVAPIRGRAGPVTLSYFVLNPVIVIMPV